MDEKEARTRASEATGILGRRLSNDVLFNIATHKYKSGTYTPIDNFLNPFWAWCASFLPLWLAPNMVTLIGLGFNVYAIYLMTVETHGTFEGPIRPWVNIVCGLCLFVYQTLDAMDGKHARATNNSSPLGQLFDHGCDALSTPLMIATLLSCIQIGHSNMIVYSLLGAQVPFFLAQWAESKTGAMQHSLGGLFGVTETQLTFIVIHLVSAFLPTEFWTQQCGDLSMLGFSSVALYPNTLLVFGVLVPGSVLMVLNQFWSTPADFASYSQLIGALLPIGSVTWYLHTSEGEAIFADHSHKILSMMAISMVYMTTQMIVMNMGHGTFAVFQPTSLVIFFSLISLNYNDMLVISIGSLDLYLQLILGAIVTTYVLWSCSAITEICYVLDIKCLTINVPKKKKKGE